MSAFLGVSVSDPWLESQFTQVELRNLESKYLSVRNESGHVTLGDLPPVMLKLKNFSELFRERDIKAILSESTSDMNQEVDYESFLQLINVAVPGTIDERAINTKRVLNQWEKNENHTLCLNSAKTIGCTVVNIGTQDLSEAETRPHLVVGLISQIIKIRLLSDLDLKKTQLLELVEEDKDVEELMGLFIP